MPSLAESCYKLTDFQTLRGQEMENIYYYVDIESIFTGSIEDVAAAFIDTCLTPIAAKQSYQLNHTGLLVERFTPAGPQDFFLFGSVGVGSEVGVAAASYASVGVKKIVNTRETKAGGVRIPGISVDDIADGNEDLLTEEGLAEWITATADLASVIGTPILADVSPVVMRTTALDTETGRYLPLPPEQWVWNRIVAVEVAPTVRTQVSRRRKRSGAT